MNRRGDFSTMNKRDHFVESGDSGFCAARRVCWESCGWMGKRKRSAFSCKSRSQRRPSPRLSASRGPPFTVLSTQGGYAHILKGYFYTNLVGTLSKKSTTRLEGTRAPLGERESLACQIGPKFKLCTRSTRLAEMENSHSGWARHRIGQIRRGTKCPKIRNQPD
jgi:hypothetical protein